MKTCAQCGVEFEPHPKAVTYQIHCNARCGGRAYAERQKAIKRIRRCDGCDANFVAGHGLQRYCSIPCRKSTQQKRTRPRWRHMSSRYGLKPADFEAMFAEQGGRCAICSVDLDGTGGDRNAPNVDHDHTTGQVRSLLCRACNIALGHLQDNPTVVAAALDYLIRWKAAELSESA